MSDTSFLRFAAIAGALLALAGCRDGGRATAPRPARELLALMVLPKAALGPDAAALGKSGPSGTLSNERRAASDLDPLVTVRSLERIGRKTGYALQFGLGETETAKAFQRGAGILKVGTLVDSYRSKAAVGAAMTKTIDDLRRLEGKPLNVGGTLARVRVVRVHGFRDRAVGLSLVIDLGGPRAYVTEVGFRVGRLAAVAVVTRADVKDAFTLTTALARRLELRIRRVLAATSLNA